MEEVLTKSLATIGGVGGLLAALMFFFYRRDAEAHAKRQEEYIAAVTSMNKTLVGVVKDNTHAVTSLVAGTHSLQTVVATLDANATSRDTWFREHLAPVFSRLVQP